VYVCEFPVAGSITVKVVVFGDKFSRYTSADGEELDDEDDEEELLFCELDDEEELCELDDEDDELCELLDDELLFCEPEPDDGICCSTCCGEEYSTLKAFPLNTIVLS
jgi:hypothetical protein